MTKREAEQIIRVVQFEIDNCDYFMRETVRNNGSQDTLDELARDRNHSVATLRRLKECQPIADALRKH